MKTKKDKLIWTLDRITEIMDAAKEFEGRYAGELAKVHPFYRTSAVNFIHYLAFRGSDIDLLHENLRVLGLPGVGNIESSVMRSLDKIRYLINNILGKPGFKEKKGYISFRKGRKILNRNTKALLGPASATKRTRIMVTMHGSAADNPKHVSKLLRSGMNSARINCAHDDPETWRKIIDNIHRYHDSTGRGCRVTMDLVGPKLRTGPVETGPGVIHIKPVQNALGQVTSPASIWIAPETVSPPADPSAVVIPVTEEFAIKIKRGDRISFVDSRGKKCTIQIVKKRGLGRWGICFDSAFIPTGTVLLLKKVNKKGIERDLVGELVPASQSIILKTGDLLNKGIYIERGMKMLSKILRAMSRIQRKNEIILPKLVYEGKLRVWSLESTPAA